MADTQLAVSAALEHLRCGRLDQAADTLLRALKREPAHAGANQLYALTLQGLNKHESAVFYIQRAIAAHPRHAEFHSNLGMIKLGTPDHHGAEAAFRKALDLDPSHQKASAALAHILAGRGEQIEAEVILRRALENDPHSLVVSGALAKVLSDNGRSDEATVLLSAAVSRRQDPGSLSDAGTMALLCLLTNYSTEDPALVMQPHLRFRRFAESVVPEVERKAALKRPRAPGDRIRVGYASPDLCRHSVTSFFEPLLKSHDRRRFEVFVYSLGMRSDEVTDRLKSVPDHWRDLASRNDQVVLDTIRGDELDVLVELSGHTLNNRLLALARRAAPVQATFLGYPATTGSPGIDARLVDGITDPAGAEAFATERLVRLSRCFLCYQPPADAPPVTHRRDGPVVFGSFNNPAKLSQATVSLWARVMREVPGSRLILKGLAFSAASVRDDFASRFRTQGIDPSVIEMLPRMEPPESHLGAYGRIDIGLDPTPYNGTTTTCEALWMGVPVVTLRTRAHAGRVGASLLSAAGMPDLIADSPEAFTRIATGLAADIARWREGRSTLRERVAASALCDHQGYAQAFEAVLAELADGPGA